MKDYIKTQNVEIGYVRLWINSKIQWLNQQEFITYVNSNAVSEDFPEHTYTLPNMWCV